MENICDLHSLTIEMEPYYTFAKAGDFGIICNNRVSL